MTIDDESSIYVGGLPYSATEETLRQVFNIYGSVVDVKIINDHNVRGKCYGFVTFGNPRSAQQAINDMDGKTIDGRSVRVNEVKTRGGRPNFGPQSFHHHTKRGLDSDKDGWDIEGDYDYDRLRDGHKDRSRDRTHNSRGYQRIHNQDRERDYNVDRDRSQDYRRDMVDFQREYQSNHGDSSERYRDQRRKRQKYDDNHENRDRDLISKLPNGSNLGHRNNRDQSAESSENDHDQAEKQLEVSNRMLEELQNEVPQIEERVQEKMKLVSELQEKLQKLEDSLKAVKKLRSQRQLQMSKLYKSFLHVRDSGERLKASEQELQSLVHSTMLEMDCDDGLGMKDVS
nr:probable splicing factor, arginine/serine-rich 6 isoform X3 [Ipomoea batatas]